MIIILGVYAALVWLVFFRLKVLPWNLITKIAVSVAGLCILLTFMALLNTRTPTGQTTVTTRVGDVASVVGGTVTEIPIKTHQKVKKGDVLFQLDKRPFEFALAQAQANYDFAEVSLKRIETAIANNPATFSRAQRDEARAAAEAASGALETARYNLDSTTVVAVADGILGPVELRVGDKVAAFKSVAGLVEQGDARLWAVFSQNGRPGIAIGNDVAIAMQSEPGVVRWAKVVEISPATSSGQVSASAQLLGQGSIGGSGVMIIVVNWPNDLPRENVEIGTNGTAMVIGPDAGAIGSLASILIRIKALINYF